MPRLNASLAQVRRELSVGNRRRPKLHRHVEEVIVIALQKGQPKWLAFHREASSTRSNMGRRCRRASATRRWPPRLGAGIVAIPRLAVSRIALKHHPMTVLPFAQTERASSHRVQVDVVTISLNHFAGHGREVLLRQHMENSDPARSIRCEACSDRARSGRGLGFVIEALALQRRLAQSIGAGDLALDHEKLAGAIAWVEQAAEAVGVVRRDRSSRALPLNAGSSAKKCRASDGRYTPARRRALPATCAVSRAGFQRPRQIK